MDSAQVERGDAGAGTRWDCFGHAPRRPRSMELVIEMECHTPLS
jgi:hypothetical protein